MSKCCIILNNLLRNWPVLIEASTGNLKPLDCKKVFTSAKREMRLMTLIKLEQNRSEFLLVWNPYTKDCYQNNTLNTKQSNY
jgi:hypothetical protein